VRAQWLADITAVGPREPDRRRRIPPRCHPGL